MGRRVVTLQTATGARATILGESEWPATAPAGPPLLCEHAVGRDETRVGVERVAMLTIATDIGYLRPWELYLWNKLCYCGREGVAFLLFLGDIDSSQADSPLCVERRASNHWIKAVAIYASLELARVDRVLVMDTDAIFRRESFGTHGLLGCYFDAIAARSSVGAGVEHYQVFVNAAVLLVRRTEWSRALVRLWWRDRCGDKDQLILWHSLFKLWSLEAPKLDYDDELLQYVSRNYSAGSLLHYKQARRVVVFDYVRDAWPEHLYKGMSPGIFHLKTDELLQFPNFALLPAASSRPPATCANVTRRLPPFRAVPSKKRRPRNSDDPSFIHHTKNRPDFDCCPNAGGPNAVCVDVALPEVDRVEGDGTPHL